MIEFGEVTVATLLIPVLTAIAVLGAGMWLNRSNIEKLKTVVIGYSNGGGHEADLEMVSAKLDRIESDLNLNREERLQEHRQVKNEVQKNRRIISQALDHLVLEINYQSDDIDLDKTDILDEDKFE